MTYIDPKATGGPLGSALAAILWTLLAIFVDRISELSAEVLIGLTGSTALVFSAILGYWTPNAASRAARAAELEASVETAAAPLEGADGSEHLSLAELAEHLSLAGIGESAPDDPASAFTPEGPAPGSDPHGPADEGLEGADAGAETPAR